MLKYLVLFALACALSLALTPLVRRLAIRLGALDRPGERKLHDAPVPRLGGLPVVLSALLALVAVSGLAGVTTQFIPVAWPGLAPILLGAAVVLLAGIWDDLRPLRAWQKFLFQAVAASLVIRAGVSIGTIQLFGNVVIDPGILAIPLTFLWIVGLTNAFNLMDGLDGLAAGLASIAAGTCAVIFLLRGDAQDAMVLTALVGALLGFLPYNFNPARIFLGDSGSMVLGFVLSVMAVTGSQKTATALAVLIPLLVFGLPIVDTLLSMLRRFLGSLRLLAPYKAPIRQRILAARKMFEADQGHIHHRLIALGFSHRRAVLLLYGVAL
ncbi:MAG: glycosyltransferase family 4 protein, partial [Nitrospirales bacterium]